MTTDQLPDFLRYRDLAGAGLTRHRLDQLLDDGTYERIAPGAFLRTNAADDTTAAWMVIAAKQPAATLCLLTALVIHELTDEIPQSSDIAIPRGSYPVTVRFEPVTWHQFTADTFSIGRTEHSLPGELSIGLYSAERTIIDMFRMRHTLGSEHAVEALKRWLRIRGSMPSKLLTMAYYFPDARPSLRAALEVLL